MPELESPQHLPGPHRVYYNAVMKGVMAPLLLGYGGLKHTGAEVFGEIEGPAIASPVHRSMLDTPVTAQAVLEATGMHVHFMGKKELWDIPGLGWLIERGGGFKVDRSQKVMPQETKDHIAQLVAHNAIIGVFPEATRREGPYINPDHIVGVPMMAAASGATIVPVGIAGTEKGNRRPIRAVFGDPIFVEKAETRRELVVQSRHIEKVLPEQMQLLTDAAHSWRDHDLKQSGR